MKADVCFQARALDDAFRLLSEHFHILAQDLHLQEDFDKPYLFSSGVIAIKPVTVFEKEESCQKVSPK